MSSDRSSSRNLPIDELPAKHRDAAARAVEGLEAREREASAARAAAADSILAEGRERLDKLLGKKKASTLRKAMAGESRKRDDLREPPESLTADREKAARRRSKRMNALLDKLGVDAKELRGIGKDTDSKLVKALGSPAGSVTKGFNLTRNLDKWEKLSSYHQFPLDWGVQPPIDPDGSGFQLFRPPFPFAIQHFDGVESSGFSVRREVTAFEDSGAIGNKLMMDCSDADSYDFAHGIVDNEMVFVYEAPASGRVQVIIDAMNTFGHHDLRIEDEFGWSEHWTNQNNYLHAMVYHSITSEPTVAQMSNFYREGNDDRTWSERALTPGNHYYAVLTSDETVSAGDTFFMGVGSRTFDITRANDVEVHSKSNFQWLIRSAEVRIVP